MKPLSLQKNHVTRRKSMKNIGSPFSHFMCHFDMFALGASINHVEVGGGCTKNYNNT